MVDDEAVVADVERAPDDAVDVGEPATESSQPRSELDEPDDDLLWPL